MRLYLLSRTLTSPVLDTLSSTRLTSGSMTGLMLTPCATLRMEEWRRSIRTFTFWDLGVYDVYALCPLETHLLSACVVHTDTTPSTLTQITVFSWSQILIERRGFVTAPIWNVVLKETSMLRHGINTFLQLGRDIYAVHLSIERTFEQKWPWRSRKVRRSLRL